MKAFWKFALWLFIGVLVLFGITLAVDDPIGGACILLFGLPVIVVIAVIRAIVSALSGRRREQAELTGQHRPQGTVEVTLTRYIRKAEARGMNDDEIERRLRRNGWSDAEIQEARRLLSDDGV